MMNPEAFVLRSRHWSQTGKWLENQQVIEFGELGSKLFNEMVASQKGTDDLGAIKLIGADHDNPNDLHYVREIFEDLDGVSGFHYILNGWSAWIKIRKDGLYEVEFGNDYFVGEHRIEALVWLFVNVYAESYSGKDVDFDWDGDSYIAKQGDDVLWTCEEKRELPEEFLS